MTDELMREVEEAVRREKLSALWRNFGSRIVGISVGVIVITAAIVLWKDSQRREHTVLTERLIDGQLLAEEGRLKEASKPFAQNRGRVASPLEQLSAVWSAMVAEQLGDDDKAQKQWKALIEGAPVDSVWRDYAIVRNLPMLDEKSPARRAAEKSIFRYSALEALAIQDLSAGRTGDAMERLSTIEQAPQAPQTLRQRARELIAAHSGAR